MNLPKLIRDRYLLSPTVKSGRVSEVFKATDAQSPGKIVALKVFRFGLFDDAVIQEAFERESRILGELQHPSIIPLLDYGIEETTRRPFLVLDWGGEDLTASIDKSNIRDWDNFYDLFGRGILEALAYAHSRGVVHRDLKPADLLRTADGVIRLADFGIAKYREFLDVNLDLGKFLCEPFTPENGHDPNYSAASDVFGFGAIVLDFLSTVPLKKWSDLKKALSEVQAPREVLDIIESAVSPDPAVRPIDAQVLLADIERIQAARRRASVRRRACFVTISGGALSGLRKNEYVSQDRDAEALVLREINANSTLRPFFRLNRDTGKRELAEGEYSLCGENIEFHITTDRESSAFLVVLSARRPSSSTDLDRGREEGWAHPFEFKIGKHPVPLEGKKVIEDLKLGFEQFEQQRTQNEFAKAEENLFRGWSEVLRVRIDQAEGNRVVHYSDRTIEGGFVTFRTQEVLDSSAVEQLWEVPMGNEFVLRGSIDNVEGELVTMFVGGRVPKHLPKTGILRLDTRATKAALKRQKDALDTVQFGSCVRSNLKQYILHPEGSGSADAEVVDKWCLEALDPDKRDAVRRALAATEFFVLHGPPGTGKTTFITELILQFLAKHPRKRVLLTSQTHIGVDNAIERLVASPRGLQIIRIGNEPGKVAESIHGYLLQNRIREWSAEVQQRAQKFVEKWSEQFGVNIREVRLGVRLGQLISLLRQKEGDEEALNALKQTVGTLGKHVAKDDEDDTTDALAVEQSRFQLEDAQEQIGGLQERIQKARSEERRMRDELKRSGDDGKALVDEKLSDLVVYQDLLLGKSEANQKFRRLLGLNNEWRQRFGSGEDSYEAILTAQNVVAGTCIGIGGLSQERLGEFDLCILDEASKATPTEALVPLAKSKKWILVGDPKQLPPYVDAALHDEDVWRRFDLDPQSLKETLLSRLQYTLPSTLQAQLSTQHRMVSEIGNLISRVFYDNALKSVRTGVCPVLSRVLPKPVTWFSTVKLRDHHEKNAGASYVNPAEAREVLKVLDRVEFYAKALRSGSARTPTGAPKLSIAVLSGYAAQTELIEHLLEQKRQGWQCIEVLCNTVDAFQGREADLAIVSLTRSNIYRRAGFLHSPERINVALSRGRNGLCIVGDVDFCRGLSDSPLRRVLEHIQAHSDECHIEEATP
jgi:serine/threonine protein kinase